VFVSKTGNILYTILLIFAIPLSGAQQVSVTTQGSSSMSFTLETAIRYALGHYPAIQAVLEEVTRAQNGVKLARTQYLPRLNPVYQADRATQNQVAGIFLPALIAPSIEGPVQRASGTSFWNTQAGALLSFEPFDFGLRRADVEQARSVESKFKADVALTRLQVASSVGEYFLNVIAARQAVRAAQANVNRWTVFDQAVRALVDQQLRPGADASRADSELAVARTQLFQARGTEQEALEILASLLGTDSPSLQLVSTPLLEPPPSSSLATSLLSTHPAALDQQARIQELRATQHVLDRTDYPRIFLESEVFGRGSGANPDSANAGGVKGLGFATGNWIAGVSIVFPDVFGFSALKDQKRMNLAEEHSQAARYQQVLQDLKGRIAAARARLQIALQVAKNTPLEVEAARQTEMQARTRYQAALANILEVAAAEDLLARTQMDDALAHLNVWRALFELAVAQGDLDPFMAFLHSKTPGRH
jgi:outer membrane protein